MSGSGGSRSVKRDSSDEEADRAPDAASLEARLLALLEAEALPESDVSAVAAAMLDVPSGFQHAFEMLVTALSERDSDAAVDAQVEVRYHLIPHLRALHRALLHVEAAIDRSTNARGG